MGPYEVSLNYSPGVKFDLSPGVTSFTWDHIRKILEISLYGAIRPRVRATKFGMWLYLMGPHEVSSNYSPGVKSDPTPGVTSFKLDYIGKILEICLYIAIGPRVTKFCM